MKFNGHIPAREYSIQVYYAIHHRGTVNDLISAHSPISAPPKSKIFEISSPLKKLTISVRQCILYIDRKRVYKQIQSRDGKCLS